jgi:DNA-binding transcriptional LysR family regulator
MPCNRGGREHRAGAGEARLVALRPDGQDLANDAFLDIVAQGFDAGIRLDEAVQHDMIAMRLTRPFNAMLAASSAYLDAKGMPTTIADPS